VNKGTGKDFTGIDNDLMGALPDVGLEGSDKTQEESLEARLESRSRLEPDDPRIKF
jgi:hypothetical protein